MKDLLLSADRDISLYNVTNEIFNNLDSLLKEFYNTKNKKYYDEKLFVKFIKNKYGKNSIKFVKVIGKCNAGEFDVTLDRFSDLVQEEYLNTKRINF